MKKRQRATTITTTFHRTLWCLDSDMELHEIKLNKSSSSEIGVATSTKRSWKASKKRRNFSQEFRIKIRDVISKLREEIKRRNVIEFCWLLLCSLIPELLNFEMAKLSLTVERTWSKLIEFWAPKDAEKIETQRWDEKIKIFPSIESQVAKVERRGDWMKSREDFPRSCDF